MLWPFVSYLTLACAIQAHLCQDYSLPSLPLHKLIYDAFGWEAPKFMHLPLILKPNGGGKLSKRDGDKGGYPVFPIKWNSETTGFRESGFLSKAVVNYLALLGWNNGDEREIFSLSELVNCFNSTGIQKVERDLIMKKQNG